MSDNISVTVRVRPFIDRETSCSCWNVDGNNLTPVQAGRSTASFVFDRVYDQLSSNEDVYNHTGAEIVKGAMDGFNGTIFAYGQTSSGKTHTMTGSDDCPGIIELAVEDMFNIIENSPELEFLIRVSYLEIYQENVIDLLGDLGRHLDVKTNNQGTVSVDGLKENVATSVEDVMNEMKQAEANRHIGATKMNDRSSRSHAIFRVIIESHLHTDDPAKSGDVDDAVKVSHLNFVDLAGSENVKQSAVSGQRLAEAGAINRSLLTLSTVIAQLSTGSTYVNYRNSRLTRILQNALGGNSKTAMICLISPASLEQSVSTLRFATSAKSVKNKPVVNEVISGETMIKRMKKEINELKKQLEKVKVRSDVGGTINEDKIELLTRLFCVSSQLGGGTSARRVAKSQVRRRETWCPTGDGMPFAAASGSIWPRPLLPPSMLPKRISEEQPPTPEIEDVKHCEECERHLEEFDKLKQDHQCHLVEFEQLKQDHQDELESARAQMADMKSKGMAMIARLKQEVTDREAELEEKKCESCERHLEEIRDLNEELLMTKTKMTEIWKNDAEKVSELKGVVSDLNEELLMTKAKMTEICKNEAKKIAELKQEVADLKDELSRATEEKENWECSPCQLHLEEIATLKKERDEAEEELEAERSAISELKAMGREMIAKHEHQVAQFKAQLEATPKLDSQHYITRELHLEEIAKLKKECDEADEELETERTAISELKTMGRELIAKHEHQVAQLEAELKATKLDSEQYVTRESYEKERQRLMTHCDEATNDLEATRSQAVGDASKLKDSTAQLAQVNIKKTMLEHELDKVHSNYQRRIRFFVEETESLTLTNKKMQNEIRDLRNKQANESFLPPPVPSRKPPKSDDCCEGGKLFELLVDNKRLTKKVESLQAALDAREIST